MPKGRNDPGLSQVANIRWGIRQAVLLTAICFVPAGLYVLVSPNEAVEFLKYLAGYLSFAVAAGVVLGLNRRRVRRRGGAMLVGAAVGVLGLLALLLIPAESIRDTTTATVAVALGALMGALAASYMWGGRARDRREIP